MALLGNPQDVLTTPYGYSGQMAPETAIAEQALNRRRLLANMLTQQGLFGLGSAGIMGGAMAFSDRRLKSNIVQLAQHTVGVPIYAYDIAGRREVGVMADELAEVMPEAVAVGADGYQRVNYALIGG